MEKEETHYLNKFKNRTKHGYRDHGTRKYTNTYSDSASRPIHYNGARELDRRHNNDVTHYGAIDYKPEGEGITAFIGRKTAAKMIVPFDDRKCRKNDQHVPRLTKKKEKDNEPVRLVYLPEISEYLYLANFCTVLDRQLLLVQKDINVVINLSNEKMSYGLYQKVHNIRMKDCRKLAYQTFAKIANEVIGIIQECITNKKKVVVCCDRGVNRSIAMIVAYDLYKQKTDHTLQGNKSLENTIDYIIKRKYDNTWPVLNNIRFYHYLQSIASNLIIG